MDMQQAEVRAKSLEETVKFLYTEVSEDDRTTIRAMIVAGGTDDQIRRSITIAAINTRIEREYKSRYAFGCLRNIMEFDATAEDAA